MTSNESGSKKSPPLFSNQSVAVAGTVAVILLVGGTLYREVDFSEEMLESSTVDEENLSGVVATEPPEPRLLYRSPDGAYSVEYGQAYVVDVNDERVLFHLPEHDPAAGQDRGIAVVVAGDKARVFAALRAAPEDSDVPEAHLSAATVIKKLQNFAVNDFSAVEYMVEDTEFGDTQVILIDAGDAGFFEIVNRAQTSSQRFVQAEEHSRILSSFMVL